MRAHVVRTGSRRGSLTSELAGQEPCSAAPPNFSRRSSRQWGEGGGSATVARCPARPVPEHRVCGKTASLGPAVMPSLGGRDTGSPLRSCLSPSTVFCPSHPPPRPRSRHRQEAREHPPNHQKSQDAALSWRESAFLGLHILTKARACLLACPPWTQPCTTPSGHPSRAVGTLSGADAGSTWVSPSASAWPVCLPLGPVGRGRSRAKPTSGPGRPCPAAPQGPSHAETRQHHGHRGPRAVAPCACSPRKKDRSRNVPLGPTVTINQAGTESFLE